MIPAVVLATLVVGAVGWFSLKTLERGHSPLKAPTSGELVVNGDLEVIKNLELLEEMDTLRKLVQVIDQSDTL